MIGLAILVAAQASVPHGDKSILDRYYQCLSDQTFALEPSGERADLVARAVVHRCNYLFVDAATALKNDKTEDARKAGLSPEQPGFEDRYRQFAIEYSMTRVIGIRSSRAR